MRWGRGSLIVCVAVSFLLPGCTTTVAGKAVVAVRDTDQIVVFNPCRGEDFDEALRSAGLDPATRHVVTDAPEGPASWRVCNWRPLDVRQHGSAKLVVTLFSTSHTLYELRKKENAVIVGHTRVNKRQGLVSNERFDPGTCYVSFDAQQGMFEVNAGWLSDEGTRIGEPCQIAQHFAQALEPHLPK
ncbi:DUF3558 domain-containing protein [Nocardia sp. NBC_01377]|uniref:DUF3558 domain-containing protein n=1 Tax=Nocardia sp. NBC_01377 TaxID=2903595 RepID=UPI00324C33CE